MSPRRTRAAIAEQSAISTRSKAQKGARKENASQNVAKSVQKTRQRKKSATAKQSTKKKSPNIKEVSVIKSTKKKTSRRKLNLDKTAEIEDTSADNNVDSNASIGLLRDKRCNNVAIVELVRTDLSQMNASKDSEKMPNKKLQRKTSATNVKLSPLVVTPKSTPPKLSLTPHRSKKTPKKSPISLGSPKTHSIAIPKLLKSPRKLSLVVAGENSNSDKKASPTAKTKHKKSNINLKMMVRKFSKSPKIVLKSPKSKSKSRKLKLSPSQVSGSLVKISPTNPHTTPNFDNAKSSKISTKESPLFKKKSLSRIKQHLLNSKIMKTLTASQIKDVLEEPVVLLEKLSSETMKRKYTLMTASKTRSNSLPKVGYSSISARRESNSKVLTSVKKASPSKSPKRNSSTKLRNSSMEKSQISNTNRISPRIKHNTSIQENKSSVPLMSSTPQEEKMVLMDTSLSSNTSIVSINNTSLNTRSRPRTQSNMQLSITIDKNTNIENVSRLSLFDKEINTSQSRLSSVAKQNVTYNKDNTMEKRQENSKNNTYELEQPQTLDLRQMINKRTASDTNLNMSLKDTVKKTKVRFANVKSDSDSEQKSTNKLNGSRSSISDNVSTQHRNNIISSAHKSKKETSKFTRTSLISSIKRSSPRTHGGTPQVQLSKIQVTPKTIASIEKKSEKKSSTKKVPNFGRIHEQMFAKSESLVDAKKRLEARHLAFTANKTPKVDMKTEGKKLLPTDTKDGVHNRFGFKLKKPEATHLVLKKQTVFSREKQQHETRLMLQGVRINRRFELQMKARNLNP